MSDSYDHGRRDGLRMALEILAAEESKWSALLGQSRSWRTNSFREVRFKTLRMAQSRVETALKRLGSNDAAAVDDEFAAALNQAGL